jgi:hypothetical protein
MRPFKLLQGLVPQKVVRGYSKKNHWSTRLRLPKEGNDWVRLLISKAGNIDLPNEVVTDWRSLEPYWEESCIGCIINRRKRRIFEWFPTIGPRPRLEEFKASPSPYYIIRSLLECKCLRIDHNRTLAIPCINKKKRRKIEPISEIIRLGHLHIGAHSARSCRSPFLCSRKFDHSLGEMSPKLWVITHTAFITANQNLRTPDLEIKL